MSSWRDQILRDFTPKVSQLTLVADPDGLLLEEGILEGIRNRGFELIPFEDSVAFRYAYESGYRSRWDRGEQTDLVVVLRSPEGDLEYLPYDLLQSGRRLSFSLGEIFPALSYPVLNALERSDLDILYEAQRRHSPGQLGDNATKEFVLRHVFEIVPELIKQPSDLLRVLLRRHYRNQLVPKILDERFVHLLRQRDTFTDWPLEQLVADRETFFKFLQERWPIFLDRQSAADGSVAGEGEEHYGLSVGGPADLPFDHDDVRVYIDNLFIEGLLRPVRHPHSGVLLKTWLGIGVRSETSDEQSRRLARLTESIKTTIPGSDARHNDWLSFARRWAEYAVLQHDRIAGTSPGPLEETVALQTQVDEAFTTWLLRRFAGLINLPPVPPVMVHHLPRFLARQMEAETADKVALILVDGLAYNQWLVIRNELTSQRPSLRFREHAVFAWVPSLTSVSRQAVFAGRAPIFFPDSILTTSKEDAHWLQFWADHGLASDEVIYQKGLGDGNVRDLVDALSGQRVKVAGLVVDTVDKIMHGMQLGADGMLNQVRQWAQRSYIAELLDLVVEQGFRVYLTSDHGNIEAQGCGRPAEGNVPEVKGERVRVYSDATLLRAGQQGIPASLAWFPIGLPENCFPLMAPSRKAFVSEKEHTVCHGGISIEELIVPLVQIEPVAR